MENTAAPMPLNNRQGGSKMKEIERIVVPVDFLETTDKLVEYAAYMAKKLSAVIHFVHAVYFYAGDAMLGLPYARDCESRLLTAAEERMANLIANNIERCRGCSGDVVVGDPVGKIVEFAREKDSQLIIISTHGSKGLETILLGSVARRVLKQAHCPVLVMNPFKKQ
jgi:nucleotide-binding universal stress UspA family protein